MTQARQTTPDDQRTVRLPWGPTLRLHADDFIGGWITLFGAYELVVTEAIVRLVDPGETAIDVGANIGQMTAAMAARVGRAGRVIAFEPCADVYTDLVANVRDWATSRAIARVEVHRLAVSAQAGRRELHIPEDFVRNRGTAYLEPVAGSPRAARAEPVRAIALDEFIRSGTRVGVLKIDVEGHEAQVLEGAAQLLERGDVRDVVMEEYEPYPARTHRLLENFGYTLYRLSGTWTRPMLLSPGDPETNSRYEMPNYLGTRDSARVLSRYEAGGWLSMLPPHH